MIVLKKHVLFLILSALLFRSLFAQKNTEFPNNMVGLWVGTLHVSNPVKGKLEAVPMTLLIAPIPDSTNVYTYEITYGTEKNDMRPYTLKLADVNRNHWKIDENNGIVLDGYWAGGAFSQIFSVQGNLIICTQRIVGKTLLYEIISVQATPNTITGSGTAESPTVETNRITGVQRAELTRIKIKVMK